MKKFKCVVTRVDEYEIEIDENIHNEKWMEDFRSDFYDFYSLEEHVEYLAKTQTRFGGEHTFVVGYGYVKHNGRLPYGAKEEDSAPGININIISEDENYEVDVEEVNDN